MVVKDLWNTSASKDNVGASDAIAEMEVRSFYGTMNVGYDEMLFAELSLRSDWSSTLPKDDNSFTYPSISGSFIFTEFLKKMNQEIPFVSFGKLRASWAQVGDDTNTYSLQPTYSLSSTKYDGNLIQSVPGTKPNENLKAALTSSTEFGLEMKFLDNRFGFDFAYFKNVNTNQIINVPVSASTGYSNTRINAGQITNSGWELALNMIPLRTDSWDWSVDFNISRSVSIIDRLYPEKNIKELSLGGYAYAMEGEQYGVFKGDVPKMHNGLPLLDTSGEHVRETDPKKRVMDRSALPDFTGGMVSTLSYKLPNNAGKLNFNVALDYQIGGTIIDINARYMNHSGLGTKTVGINDKGGRFRDPIRDRNNKVVDGHVINAKDAGSKTGGMRIEGYDEDTKNPVAYYIHPKKYYHYSNIYRPFHAAYDASFIKLRELLISYSLPKSLLQRTGITSASIGLVLRDMLLYSDADISIDPSQAASSYQPWISWGQLPSTNTLGLNLNLTF